MVPFKNGLKMEKQINAYIKSSQKENFISQIQMIEIQIGLTLFRSKGFDRSVPEFIDLANVSNTNNFSDINSCANQNFEDDAACC
jgi:hypothetical protein